MKKKTLPELETVPFRTKPETHGDLLLVAEFKVTPDDYLRYVVDDDPLDEFRRPPTLQAVPLPLLVARANARLRGLRGERFEIGRVCAARSLIPAVVGEPIACVARVKYRGASGDFLTLEVELRRRRGPVVARFELVAEVKLSPTPERVRTNRAA